MTDRVPVVYGSNKSCPRCGNEHIDLPFYHFTKPPVGLTGPDGQEKDCWALCPDTGEPILAHVVRPTQLRDSDVT